MKKESDEATTEQKSEKFCDEFYLRGLQMKAFRHMKIFAQVAGNQMQMRRLNNKIKHSVAALREEKKNHMEYLTEMVIELEEKYRIELRKKAILKN
jgi:hypothetical protein